MSRLRHKLPAHRKDGGKAGLSHQTPTEIFGKPSVISAAKAGGNLGSIGGVKSKHRADRARGGSVHSDAAADKAMINRMVKKDALSGAKKDGGCARRATGGAVGPSQPYSTAGRGLRHGGSCH